MTSKRIALITGGNKGLGLETGRQLGKQGITIIVAARDAKRGAHAATELKAEGIDAHAVVLDVTDPSTIKAAAAYVEHDFGHLDILVNNAGVLDYPNETGPSKTTVATFRSTFETNVFGLIEVTQAFLPLLHKSPAGRIVNLSSILGSIAEHRDTNSFIYGMRVSAYDASKAAVNMYTAELAEELRGTKIKVNAAHPGWVKTDLGGPDAPMELVDGAKTGVALALVPEHGPTGGFYHLGVHMRW